MKICCDCLANKSDDEMHRHSSGRLYPYCKDCQKVRRKKYDKKYNDANREAVNSRMQKFRDENKGDPDYRERQRRYSREARQRHGDRNKKYNREYRVKNRDRFRVYEENRRARKSAAGGSFTPQEWQSLCESYGWQCLACGEKVALTIDHVKPISLGGTSDIGNIQPLCGPCNSRKGASEKDYRRLE